METPFNAFISVHSPKNFSVCQCITQFSPRLYIKMASQLANKFSLDSEYFAVKHSFMKQSR